MDVGSVVVVGGGLWGGGVGGGGGGGRGACCVVGCSDTQLLEVHIMMLNCFNNDSQVHRSPITENTTLV